MEKMYCIYLQIILLVLLPALVSGAREQIDWTKCQDIMCYCGDANNPPQLVARDNDIQGCEKIGVQSQFFTENAGLFQVQLTLDPTDPLMDSEILRVIILYGSIELFGCEYNIKKGTVILFGDEESIFNYKIKLFEEKFNDRSYLDSGSLVCAVTVERYSKFSKKVIEPESILPTSSKKASITLADDSIANTKTFEFQTKVKDLLVPTQYIKCNPAFKSVLFSSEYYVEPVRNKDRYILNCDNYGTSYTMRYEKAGVVDKMLELTCALKGTAYVYTIVKEDDVGNKKVIDVPDPESYSIFCTATFNELCKNPNTCTKAEDPNCPVYVPGSKGVAATLTCPDNKWKIKDEFYELKDQPACERNRKTNGASFVAVLPSNQSVLITKEDRCFTDWDCKKKSNLNIPSGSVIIDNGIMKCNDTEAKMIVYHDEKNITMTGAQSYKCNQTDGVFFNEANPAEKVRKDSRVSCRVNKKSTTQTTEAESSITKAQVYGIIVGSAVLLILIVIGFATCGFRCYRHRNDVSIKNLKKMNRSALAEKCIKDFHHIVKAVPSNSYLIVVGFTLVDKMLEMEVDDPKAWEEAGKFLTRAHGSIMRRDFQVWHLLSRYCHLQATKIIDKYGWRTDAPITNANPNGIIRCVAVQLLAFCLNDHANYTAEEYIEYGYGQLGFRGSSQYPHAGVMWSVVPHTRRGQYLRNAKHPHLLINGFNKALFCDVTRKIACKKMPIAIPDGDVIPEFGTVQEQAAYALGGQPCHMYLVNETNNILFGTEEMPAICAPIAYLKGMCETRGRDPAQILLDSYKIFSDDKEKFLAKMNLLAPEPVWHKVWRNAFQLLSFYGRDLDIQRIHSSFMPKDKSTDFFEIEREQANFEKAIDSALEDIREWLSKHTDKDEFKKKPTMVVNPKVTLRQRRYAAGQTGGCSTSDKSSGAGKPPAAAAAAAAAAAGTPVAAGTAPTPRAAGSPGAAAPPTTAAAAAAAPAAGPPIAAAAAMPTAPVAPTPTA